MMMKRWLKATGFISGVLVACGLIIVVGLCIYAETDHFRQVLLERINTSIAGNLTLGDHDISFLKRRISLQNLNINDQAANRLVTLEYLKADVDLWPLLKRTIVFKTIIVKNPQMRLKIERNGSIDMVRAVRPKIEKTQIRQKSGNPFKIIAKDLQITNGDFQIIDEQNDLHVDLGRISMQAGTNIYKKIATVKLQVDDILIDYAERRLKIHPLVLSAKLSADQSAALALEARTNFGRIILNGKVQEVFHNPVLILSLAFDFPLRELNKVLALPFEWSGTTKGVLNVKGNWRNPDADLRLGYNGGTLAGFPVKRLHADLRLKDRKLTIPRIDIQAASGEISMSGDVNLQSAFPKGVVSAPIDYQKIDYTIRANLKHIDLSSLPKIPQSIEGVLTANVNVEGANIDFKKPKAAVILDAKAERFFMKGMHRRADLQVHASGKLRDGLIDLNRGTVMTRNTRLNAQGIFDPAAGRIQGQLMAKSDNIADPLSLLGLSGYTGAFTVQAGLSGFRQRPDIEIELSANKFQLHGVRLGDVLLKARLNESGQLNIASLKLNNQGTRIEGNGNIRLFTESFRLHESMPFQARLRFFDTQIHDFLTAKTVKGIFEGDLQLNGDIHSPQATLALSGKDVAYQKVLLGETDAEIRFTGGALHLDQLRLRRKSSACFLTGAIRLFEAHSWQRLANPVLNLDLRGEDLAVSDFRDDIQGVLDFSAHFEGPASRLTGSGFIKGENLAYKGQHIQRMTLAIELRDNRLHVPSLQAVVARGSVVGGSGWIGFDQRFYFNLQATDMSLTSIDKLKDLENITADVDFHVRGEGYLKDPSLLGNFRVKGVHINNEKMDDFNFRVELIQNQLSIQGRQTFELNGDYHLLNKDFHVDLLFMDTDMTPFLLIMGIKDLGGRLSGRVVAEGNTTSIKKSTAFLDVSNFSLTYGGKAFADTDQIQGSLQNQRLSISEVHLNILESGRLHLKGSADFDGYFNLMTEGEIPANTLAPFLRDVTEIEGGIHMRAAMKGTAAEPELSGEMIFRDVEFTLPQLDSPLKDINGKIRLASSIISIENMTGSLDSGRLLINGDIAIENRRPGKLQMEFKTHRLPIHVPETMDVLINSDLLASGTLENLMLDGEIVLLEGFYYKDVKIDLLSRMKEKKRPVTSSPEKTYHAIFDNITTNIKLKYREPFIVDNNVAYLEVHPDLFVSSKLNSPVITGTAKVQDGTLTYQNNVFAVEKGIISFVNPYEIKPEIDITGSTQIRQWRISLALNGTPDRLVVELSSVPAEADADILSLLVFGKTTGEMAGQDNGPSDSTEALLAKVLASSFGRDIKKTTGLDYLEVETETGEAEGDSDAVKVTVGKDLTERMSVKYTIGTGKSGYHQRATTEYKLIEHILLSGFQDTKGNYGGEIIFRVEFRMFP